ncbi:MAG: hypothetical protein KJ955_06695 [Nanoarchaeota archaeon]|nr:hypothetical protein [Nanoarchaeota archaeon]
MAVPEQLLFIKFAFKNRFFFRQKQKIQQKLWKEYKKRIQKTERFPVLSKAAFVY